MQAIHFSFGLGALAAPLLAEPLIAHSPAANDSASVLLCQDHLRTLRPPPELPADLTSDTPAVSDVPNLPGRVANRFDRLQR